MDIILLIIVVVSLLALSLIIYHKNSSNKTNRYFSLALFWTAFWATTNYLESEPVSYFTSVLLLRLDFASASLLTYYFFSFCLNFPSFYSPFNLKEKYFFLPALGLAILSFTDLIIRDIGQYQKGVQLQFKTGSLFIVYAIYLFGCFGISLYSLFKKRKESKGIVRNQLFYILIGFILPFSIALIINLVLSQIIILPLILSRVGIYSLLFLIIMTYAILKYRLMGINIVIKKGVATFILFLGIGLTSILVILAVERNFYNEIDYPLVVLNSVFIFLMILSAVIFHKYNFFIEKIVEKTLFKDKYDYLETISQFGERVINYLDLEKLLEEVTNTLVEGLKLEDIAIYLFQEETREYWLAKDFNSEKKKQNRFTEFDPYILFMNSFKELVVWEEAERLGVKHPTWQLHFNEAFEDLLSKIVIPRMKESGIALTIPLISEEKIIGIIHLGNKTTKEMWTNEDLKLLNELSERITTALINSIEHGDVKKLYMARSRRERIMSLAELTAGICHQFRNLVNSSRTFFQLFTGDAENLNDLLEFKKVVEHDIARMVSIIDEVQKFSEVEINIAHIETNINEVLNKMITLISKDRKYKIDFIFDLDKNLPNILGDETALLDVFRAIGINAVEAMENSQEKKLLIKSQLVNVKSSFKREQRSCRIEITDTGEGIKTGDLAKIFNPMHTTKEMHIGLNLAIAHKIIEAHGGYMEVKSEIGKGTSFFVNLALDYKPKREDVLEDKKAHKEGKKIYMGG